MPQWNNCFIFKPIPVQIQIVLGELTKLPHSISTELFSAFIRRLKKKKAELHYLGIQPSLVYLIYDLDYFTITLCPLMI